MDTKMVWVVKEDEEEEKLDHYWTFRITKSEYDALKVLSTTFKIGFILRQAVRSWLQARITNKEVMG